MITVILDFLKTHWLGTLAGTAALGIFTTLSVQHFEIAHLKAKLEQAVAENLSCEYANHALTATIEKQNALIIAEHNAAEERAQKSLKARQAAKTLTQKYVDAAARIENEKPQGDDCSSAKILARKYIRNLP